MHRQIVKEHLRGHRPHRIRAGGVWRWAFHHAVTQLLRAGEIEVTPRAGFCLIAQLLQRIRLQVAGCLVVRIGEHHFTHHLRHPAIVPLVEVGFRLLQNGVRAAHVLDKFLRRVFRRQLIQGRRVAVEPAEIEHVGRFHVVAHRAVVTAVRPGVRQRVRQLEVGGDLIPGQPLISHAQGLIVDISVEIALAFQQVIDVLFAPGRPVVLGHQHLGLITPAHNGFVDVFRPRQRLADLRPAQGVGIVQGVGHVFGRFDQLFLFDKPQHFRRRFRARRQHKIIGQTVDGLLLTVFFDDIGRGNQGDGPGGSGGAQSGADLTFGIRLQQVAVHVAGAAAHHVTGHNVLCHRGFHKAGRGVDFHLPGFNIGFVHHTAHAAVMVHVAVGVDHRHHRLLPAVFKIEIHPDFRRFRRHQRVNDGDAGSAFDNGHIRQIEVTDLIHPVRHLKQAADVNQLRLTP